MGILLREFLGSESVPIDTKAVSLTESFEPIGEISKDSIMVDVEAIHVGPTRNFTWYTEEALRGSVNTWTSPYQRPFIYHHNEKDGEVIGRVLGASYQSHGTRSGTGALILNCNISDEKGVKGVKDGRLKTTSIGVIAHSITCSICGQSLTEDGECEHIRGVSYNGETCYWMIHSMEAKEISYVIVPSDIYAHNIRVYSPENINEKGDFEMSENLIDQKTCVNSLVSTSTNTTVQPFTLSTGVIEASKIPTLYSNAADEVAGLKRENEDLKRVLSEAKRDFENADKLRIAAEEELVEANKNFKEFAVEQLLFLRESLGKKKFDREVIEKRTISSLIDGIADLREEFTGPTLENFKLKEANVTEKATLTESLSNEVDKTPSSITESKEEPEKVETAKVENLQKVCSEGLVDETKDTSIKNEENNEKKSALDVKEGVENSNTEYEDVMNLMNNFYKL